MGNQFGRRQFLKLSGISTATALTLPHTLEMPSKRSFQQVTNHRFIVTVPNTESQAVNVHLRLEPAQPNELETLYAVIPESDLTVIDVGLATDSQAGYGDVELDLTLEPNSSIDVYVLINTDVSNQPGKIAFHLIDERDGVVVGGVLLVATDPPIAEPVGQVIPALSPCPATLATDTYWIVQDEDPSLIPNFAPLPRDTDVEFVAPVTNPTANPLVNMQIYLENLGECNGEFLPGTWNIGTLEPGQVFYATWLIRSSEWRGGTYSPSLVVLSDGTEPTRLEGKLNLGERITSD